MAKSRFFDHGNQSGLSDDDHTQYLTESRHDGLAFDNPHGVTFEQTATASGYVFTNNRLIRADLTNGLQDSGITVDDSDNMTGGNDVTLGGELTVPTLLSGGQLNLNVAKTTNISDFSGTMFFTVGGVQMNYGGTFLSLPSNSRYIVSGQVELKKESLEFLHAPTLQNTIIPVEGLLVRSGNSSSIHSLLTISETAAVTRFMLDINHNAGTNILKISQTNSNFYNSMLNVTNLGVTALTKSGTNAWLSVGSDPWIFDTTAILGDSYIFRTNGTDSYSFGNAINKSLVSNYEWGTPTLATDIVNTFRNDAGDCEFRWDRANVRLELDQTLHFDDDIGLQFGSSADAQIDWDGTAGFLDLVAPAVRLSTNNITIGDGAAADHTLTFNSSSTNGEIKYEGGENSFLFDNSIAIALSTSTLAQTPGIFIGRTFTLSAAGFLNNAGWAGGSLGFSGFNANVITSIGNTTNIDTMICNQQAGITLGTGTVTDYKGVTVILGAFLGAITNVTGYDVLPGTWIHATAPTIMRGYRHQGWAGATPASGKWSFYADADTAFLGGGLEMPNTQQIQFRDTAIHIKSLTDGHLDLTADISIDMNANMDISTKNIVTDAVTGTIIATATTQLLAFWAGTPVAQPVNGVNLTNNVTSGGTNDTISDYSDLVVYATDAAAIRNAIFQLARKLKVVNDSLRVMGLNS